MVSKWGSRIIHQYDLILPYLARHKMWDKIEEVAAKGVSPTTINQAKVVALLAE